MTDKEPPVISAEFFDHGDICVSCRERLLPLEKILHESDVRQTLEVVCEKEFKVPPVGSETFRRTRRENGIQYIIERLERLRQLQQDPLMKEVCHARIQELEWVLMKIF